ncbi:MAG: helicase HerA-like domain-containing protein [Pseudomonadota bacterium]
MSDATDGTVFIGGGGAEGGVPVRLTLKRANRHGLIAGATGTGKTVTLQTLAESFSNAGVPVFLSDVKGDLTGLCQPGSHAHKAHDALVSRATKIGFDDFGYEALPVTFWDMFGEDGHPVRATVSEMGPMLLARLLDLNDVQEGVLHVVFKLADEEGLLLLDFKDLRALLTEVSDRAAEMSARFGLVSKASVAAIQRKLLMLETEGGGAFFGEPALKLEDMIATEGGRGKVNVLAARRLMNSPRLYATFLLWLLSELFETLPEVGDPDKPVFVFFFDEAHLLFDRAPRPLIDTVERVARLIRSKGVGVYFVTQSPSDVPEDILGQLGNRVQHALRSYTPKDAKAVKAAAQSFRPNPAFDAAEVIPNLGIGEALVSVLDPKGAPTPVERTLIRPPMSRLGPADAEEVARLIAADPLGRLYGETVDRKSAFEMLEARAQDSADAPEPPQDRAQPAPSRLPKVTKASRKRAEETARAPRRPQPDPANALLGAAASAAVSMLKSRRGRAMVRGLLGSLFKGR